MVMAPSVNGWKRQCTSFEDCQEGNASKDRRHKPVSPPAEFMAARDRQDRLAPQPRKCMTEQSYRSCQPNRIRLLPNRSGASACSSPWPCQASVWFPCGHHAGSGDNPACGVERNGCDTSLAKKNRDTIDPQRQTKQLQQHDIARGLCTPTLTPSATCRTPRCK